MDLGAWTRTLRDGVLLSGLVCALAAGQQVTTALQTTLPSSRGGLIGQRAALPNVLGRNRSLPLERTITLPGLPAGTPTVYRPGAVPGVVGRPYIYRGYDDGVRIDGSYDGDKLSIDFHLGSNALRDGVRVYYPYRYRYGGYYIRDGRYYYDPSWYYYRSGTYLSTAPVHGMLGQQVDYTLRAPQLTQPQAPAKPERELTTIERATLLMAAEELTDAIESFRDHLDEDPEDVEAMRSLGVAMIENNRMEDGIAMIALAYRTDPMLARTVLDLDELGLDSRRYDRLLSRVLQYAKRVDSGAGHLAGAMLLQADGKVAGASRVLDRAERAGLSEEILDPMRRELGIPAGQP